MISNLTILILFTFIFIFILSILINMKKLKKYKNKILMKLLNNGIYYNMMYVRESEVNLHH